MDLTVELRHARNVGILLFLLLAGLVVWRGANPDSQDVTRDKCMRAFALAVQSFPSPEAYIADISTFRRFPSRWYQASMSLKNMTTGKSVVVARCRLIIPKNAESSQAVITSLRWTTPK